MYNTVVAGPCAYLCEKHSSAEIDVGAAVACVHKSAQEF